jgi:RNA polymerase sigma-70 factor, ECF subfamily
LIVRSPRFVGMSVQAGGVPPVDAGPDDGGLTDAGALAALRSGDPGQIRRVVEAWTPAMLRLARVHTRSETLAEDVVQDSWITVLTKLETFEGRSALKTWVLGIVVNRARRAGVRERRVLPFSAAGFADRADLNAPAVDPARFGPDGGWVSPPLDWEDWPEERLAASELRDVIEAALTTLPMRQRAVVTVRDILGLSADDVEALYGLSAANQRVLLHRARAKLRAAVERYAAGEPVEGAITPEKFHGRAARPPKPGAAIACRQLVELVDDYRDNSLQEELRAKILEHLPGCDHCNGYVDQVRRVLDVTSGLSMNADDAVVMRLLAAVRGTHDPSTTAA